MKTSRSSHQTIPAYVINLDRRTDRWKTISENLQQIGVRAERIPAVEAQALAARDEREIELGGVPLYRINYGSAANMMGHANAMKRLLLSQGTPAALILEDDAELSPDTADLLRSTDWWPKGALAVRLEDDHRGRGGRLLWRPCGKTPSGRDLCRFERRIPGSAAYLISRRGAEIVLDSFQAPRHTTDGILFNVLSSALARRLRTVQVVPAVARQRPDAGSDQVEWRDGGNTAIRLTGRPRGFLDRNLWNLPHKLRLWLLVLTGRVRKVRLEWE